MTDYLVGFSYHEPEPYALWLRGVIEDYESSTGIWIAAASPSDAKAWGEVVATELHKAVNKDPNATWARDGHFCWIEEEPESSGWAHCLDFFPRVAVGEMPVLERIGTEAYVKWMDRKNSLEAD